MARFLKHKILASTAPLALASVLVGAQPARAVLTYNIYESGFNVVVQSSGSLNLAGAQAQRNSVCTVAGALISSVAGICTGPSNPGVTYTVSGPNSFAGTALLLGANSVSGFSSALVGNAREVLVEVSYTGGPISGSATFNNKTLAGLGFTTPGLIGSWTIDGTSESINVVVGAPSAVPGPLPLLGAGAAFGFSRRLRRRVNQSRFASNHADSISA